MFQKRNSLSDNSRGISTQTIVNNIENNGEDNRSVATDNDSDRHGVHSNWSEFITEEAENSKLKNVMNVDASISTASLREAVHTTNAQPRKRPVKNIVLVPDKPKPTGWGSWK